MPDWFLRKIEDFLVVCNSFSIYFVNAILKGNPFFKREKFSLPFSIFSFCNVFFICCRKSHLLCSLRSFCRPSNFLFFVCIFVICLTVVWICWWSKFCF